MRFQGDEETNKLTSCYSLTVAELWLQERRGNELTFLTREIVRMTDTPTILTDRSYTAGNSMIFYMSSVTP